MSSQKEKRRADKGATSRRCGTTDKPDMDVVIGYNVYPEGRRNKGKPVTSPIILLNAEPDLIKEHGLPGFEGVGDSKRVLYRRVAGNNFFYELVKTSADHERIFLICETTEKNMENLNGQPYTILFVGKNGQEVLKITPCANSKDSAMVVYKEQDLGRIVKMTEKSGDQETAYIVQDSYEQKIFELRKSYQLLKNTICCLPRPMRKVANGLAIFGTEDENTAVSVPVGTINNSQITFSTNVELIQKTLLLAALICIKTKALETGS